MTGHRVLRADSTDAYAVYSVDTVSGSQLHSVELRCAELRQLYSQMWAEWKRQLHRSAVPAPSFWHHSRRGRLDDALLRAREREMEAVLVFFASALELRLADSGAVSGP